MAVSAAYRVALQKFGGVVRRRRKMLGLSQEKFAEVCGMDRTHIGEIERGEGNLGTKYVVRIARGLDRKISELWAEAGL